MSASYMSASATDSLLWQTRTELHDIAAQSAWAPNACQQSPRTLASGQQCDSVKNRNLPRATAAPTAQRPMSWDCCEYSRRVMGPASAFQHVALRKIRGHHQDDLKCVLAQRLRLPALPAAFPLAAVVFQGNDDGEQRRRRQGIGQ